VVKRLLVLPLLVGLPLAACGTGSPACDDTAGMPSSPGGLRVTAREHGEAWGQPTCAGCHAFEALHRTGCTPGVDLSAVRAQVRDDGAASCAGCHGDNGVAP